MEPVSATHTAMVAALAMSDAVHTVKKKQNAPQRSHHHPGQTPWPSGPTKGPAGCRPARLRRRHRRWFPCHKNRSSPARRDVRLALVPVLHPELGGWGVSVPWLMTPHDPPRTKNETAVGGSDARARGRSRYFLAAEHRSIRRFASRGWRRPAASPVQHTSGFCSVLLSTRLCSAVDRVPPHYRGRSKDPRGRAQRARTFPARGIRQARYAVAVDVRVRHARWAPERRLGVLSARGSRFSF